MPDNQFTRCRRLLNKHEFDRVFKDNSCRHGSGEFLLLARHNELGHSRLGMVIGKKTVASAARRNNIKRRLREHFRQVELPPVDLVVVGRKGCASIDNGALNEAIAECFSRLNARLAS